MYDTLMEALRKILVEREHKLDTLDEVIDEAEVVLAIGIKDGKAKVIYVARAEED